MQAVILVAEDAERQRALTSLVRQGKRASLTSLKLTTMRPSHCAWLAAGVEWGGHTRRSAARGSGGAVRGRGQGAGTHMGSC